MTEKRALVEVTVNLVCENFSFAHWFECQLGGMCACTMISPEMVFADELKDSRQNFYAVDCQCFSYKLLKKLLSGSGKKSLIILLSPLKDFCLDDEFANFLGKNIFIHCFQSSFVPLHDFLKEKIQFLFNSFITDIHQKMCSLPSEKLESDLYGESESLLKHDSNVFFGQYKKKSGDEKNLVFCSNSANPCFSDSQTCSSEIASRLDFLNEESAVSNFHEKLRRYAASGFDILLLGECGCGKSWTARQIFEMSGSCGKFVEENLASINVNLLESHLFGCEDGAYTGAKRKRGLFEETGSGTLFLDEIGDLSLELQPKLLDVIENRVYRRMGSMELQNFSGRIIFATNKNLENCIKNKTFRKDLYDRINMLVLEVLPLRCHPSDIIPLAEKFASNVGKKLTDSFCRKLLQYDYPGNIRELKNIVIRSCILSQSTVVDGDGVFF